MLYKFIVLLIFCSAIFAEPIKLLNEKELSGKELFFDISKAIDKKDNCFRLCLGGQNIAELNSDICNLSRLQDLNISQNAFRVLPENFGNLQNLTELNLSGNKFARLPESFTKLQNLKYLDLSSLEHTDWDNIFQTLSGLNNLETLDLSFNKFPFHFLNKLPLELKKLIISETNVPDEFIKNFKQTRIQIEVIK